MNNKAKSDGRSQTLGMVQVALFAALIIIMAFTPFLASPHWVLFLWW